MGTNKKLKQRFALVLAVVMALSIAVPRFSVLADDLDFLTADPSSIDFGSHTVGYTQIMERTVTITIEELTGSALLPLPTVPNWTLEQGGDWGENIIDDPSTRTFTIRPNDGLSVGSYDTSFSIILHRGVGDELSVEIQLHFTVTPIIHAVTFDLGDGTQTCDVELNQTVTHGGNATPPTATRSGYNFAGWYPVGGYNNVTDSITITARWTQVEVAKATTDVPRTGDDTQLPWLHLVMSFLAIGLGATVLFLLRKKKKGGNNA